MNLSLIESLIFFGSIQGLGLFAILSWSRRYRCLANKLLASFILCISLIILRNIAEAQHLLKELSYLAIIANVLIPLIGPLIYLYVKYLTLQTCNFNKRDSKHFLLAILYALIINTAAIFGITTDAEIAAIPWLSIVAATIQLAVLLQLIGYLAFSINYISTSIQNSEDSNVTIKVEHLIWLKRLLVAVISILLIWITLFAADIKILKVNQPKLLLELFWLTFSVLIYWIGYYHLLNPDIFTANQQIEKIKRSAILNEKLDEQLAVVDKHMQDKKPYLDSELTLKKLALQLDMNSKELSQTINLGKNKTFIDYVNFYRIEEIKAILQKSGHRQIKIEIVAYEAGIKSSSTLNRLFKKYVNMTPSQYRAQFE